MYIPPTKSQIINQSKQYYKKLVSQATPTPFFLNISLTSNPFLKDKDTFKYLKFQLTDYNKRIQRKQIKDSYEILSYHKLHSMLSDLSQIDSREDQIIALQELNLWYKQQNRLIQQRHSQGNVRYDVTKLYRDIMKMEHTPQIQQVQQELNIPYYLVERILEPYRRDWRTLHNQYENPAKRLGEYKRKTINIATFTDNKQDIKPSRVLYPMPPKYEPKQEQPQKPPQNQQQPHNVPQGEQPPIDGQPPPQNPQPQQANNAGDMGGFGQQPQQPQQEQPPQQLPDKLKPKNPIYIDAISTDKQKKYKESYMFYLGNEKKQQRNMQLRYIRKYHDNIRKQKQDEKQLQIAHDWSYRKAKISKDMQKRLQQMKFKPMYTFSKQPLLNEQKISIQDQIKYGFTTVIRPKQKYNQFDISLNQLPKINQTFDQKSIRRDRLNSLKGKFGKLLNLTEQQSRQSAPSLCQYTQRRRGLSEIIRNHSHSKERLQQLQEVSKIKEKLTKVKININIKALSKGLCLPENQDFFGDGEKQFPNKELPSNPDMVETKKKKKKKK